jgi:hypothetical protein
MEGLALPGDGNWEETEAASVHLGHPTVEGIAGIFWPLMWPVYQSKTAHVPGSEAALGQGALYQRRWACLGPPWVEVGP